MRRVSKALLLTGVILVCLTDVATPGDTVDVQNVVSLHALLSEDSPERRKALAKNLLNRFEDENYGTSRSIREEFLSVLSTPDSGYADGCRIAQLFAVPSEMLAKGIGDPGPIEDISREFNDVSRSLNTRINALAFKLRLSGGLDLQDPDTLFIYWNGRAFRIPYQGFRGASAVDDRYALLRVVRFDAAGVTRLELWSLDTETATLHRILDIVVDKWVSHGGTHYAMEVPTWYYLGTSLGPIDAYYREEIPTSRAICTDGGLYNVPRSPYFIHYIYEYNPETHVYAQSGGETLRGREFLMALSRLAAAKSAVGVGVLLRDFIMFDPDPIKTIEAVFSELDDSVQVDAIQVIQGQTGIVCGPEECADRFFAELEPTVKKWREHYSRSGCNFPWKP